MPRYHFAQGKVWVEDELKMPHSGKAKPQFEVSTVFLVLVEKRTEKSNEIQSDEREVSDATIGTYEKTG